MTITEAREGVGRGVVYRAPHNRPNGPAEDGTITSVGERFVFVLYVGDRGAKATDPADLEWLVPA